MQAQIQWKLVCQDTGTVVSIISDPEAYHHAKEALGPRQRIMVVTSDEDEFPAHGASCSITEWLIHEIRGETTSHTAAWARGDHEESRRASTRMNRLLGQLERLAAAGESAQAFHSVVDQGPSKQEQALMAALGNCRDVFPVPDQGSDLERLWVEAMGDPETVPIYIQAIQDERENEEQERYDATSEKDAFDQVFTPAYLAHREERGVDAITEFAFSVWCHARLPVRLQLSKPTRNETLLAAAKVLADRGQDAAAHVLRLLVSPVPGPFAMSEGASGWIDSAHGLLPAVGSTWNHHNGNRYTVFGLLNVQSNRLEKYPPMVAYVGDNGNTWARPASRWTPSMTLIDLKG